MKILQLQKNLRLRPLNSEKIKREREELEAVYYLCRAWENMELAEKYKDPYRFSEASGLFAKASDLFTDAKLKFLASGNSTFCQAHAMRLLMLGTGPFAAPYAHSMW